MNEPSSAASLAAQRAEAMRTIERIDATSRQHHTPCGEGTMVWREWGTGPTLVLLHGGFGSWMHWIRNIEPLSAHFRVLAADLPGLGESAALPEPIEPRDLGETVGAGLESLLAAGEQFDLVGFSFGGLVSGQVALVLGPRLRSLTLVGASGLGISGTNPVQLVRRTPDMTAAEREAAQRSNAVALMLRDPSNLDELAFEIQTRNDAAARVKSRRFSRGDSLRSALAEIDVPINGIWGEFDATASPSVEARRDLLIEIHPDTHFRLLPGIGHWAAYEGCDAFNCALKELLGH